MNIAGLCYNIHGLDANIGGKQHIVHSKAFLRRRMESRSENGERFSESFYVRAFSTTRFLVYAINPPASIIACRDFGIGTIWNVFPVVLFRT